MKLKLDYIKWLLSIPLLEIRNFLDFVYYQIFVSIEYHMNSNENTCVDIKKYYNSFN